MQADSTFEMRGTPSLAVVFAGAAWLVSYFLARYLLEALAPHSPWDIAVASIPVFGCYAFVWAVQRDLRKADELSRRIHLEALALAFLTTLLVLMLLGLLDAPPVGPLGIPLRDFWLALPPLYGVCYLVASRRYR